MLIFEIVYLILLMVLGLITTISDFKSGIIRNKVLVKFAILALGLNVIYYGLFANDLLIDFLLNFFAISVISLFLFYSHSLAGGDCKLIIVFALLYPSRWLVTYNGNQITLFATIGISILLGYIYLLFDSIFCLIKKKNKIDFSYVKQYITNFLFSFLTTLIYLSVLNMLLYWINTRYVAINIWIIRMACILFAWIGWCNCWIQFEQKS